jgi:hypothetical protein
MFELIDDGDSKRTRRFVVIVSCLFIWGVMSIFIDTYLHRSIMQVVFLPACVLMACRDWSKHMNKYHASHLWIALSVIFTVLIVAASWRNMLATYIALFCLAAVTIQLESMMKNRSLKRAKTGEAQP